MSLKVPRNFKTYSEDAIVAQYAGQRRKFAHQDRIAQRRQNDSENLSLLAKMAIVAAVVITVAAFAKPALQFLQSFL